MTSISRFKNLPNLLTFFRLVISFVLSIILYYVLPLNDIFLNSIVAASFIFFSLTDFFDGYFARKYNLESKLGKALDPIADKFFVLFPLIALTAIGKIYFLFTIIFVGRELFVMSLRQIALENNFNINVTFSAKLKTTMQIIMTSLIILNPKYNSHIYSFWNDIQMFTIFIALFLSLFSALKYYKKFRFSFN